MDPCSYNRKCRPTKFESPLTNLATIPKQNEKNIKLADFFFVSDGLRVSRSLKSTHQLGPFYLVGIGNGSSS